MSKENFQTHDEIHLKEQNEDQYDPEEERIDEEARVRRREERKRKEEESKDQYQGKMIVATGFGINITDHFDFGKSEDCLPEISGSHLAWIIVLYAVCNSAMIPPWIMNIKANKYLRISWRFLMQTVMMIPFVLYEYRTGDKAVKEKYKLSYILERENLRSIYITSLATSFWFTTILTCFDWTYISHSMVLGGLGNLFISLYNIFKGRSSSKNGGGHEMEIGGHLVVLIGIILVMCDSYTLDTSLEPADCATLINPLYLRRTKWQRVMSNIGSLLVSLVMSIISRTNRDPKSYLPSNLSVMISNIFVSLNMSLSGYFFNGATFNMDPVYGIFSIFSEKHFTGFLYMSIILGLGLFLSSVMITKIFDEKLTPSLAMQFEPVASTLFLRAAGVQCMPGTIATLGYVFVIPGMFLINFGQNELDKKRIQAEKKKKEEASHTELQDRNKHLEERNEELESRNKELTESLLSNTVQLLVNPFEK